jgi:16S rRNA (cytosine967-C5)-methyltransferase
MLRCAAARINAAVVADGVSLDRALEAAPQDDPRDAALLRAISYGALRWHHRLQWQSEQLLIRPLSRSNPEIAALLRVGLFQLQGLRIPDHAAVGATVEAAVRLGAARAKGLVNAVLRRFQRERERLEAEMQDHREALTSHPAWLLDLIAKDRPEESAQILAANNQSPPMWLRVNALRESREAYLRRLDAAGIEAEPSAEVQSAVALTEPCPVSTVPGFAEGLVSVQDAAAQCAAALLDLRAGQRVLDACAAPGGKAAHILESCPGIRALVAVERDAERLSTVRETFARLGLSGVTRHGDARRPAEWWDGEPFDRILLDAPCSGLGVIRRHPDIKVLRRPDDVTSAAAEQRALLDALWPLLKPGGRLVYATCTIAKHENEEQIERFLAARADTALARPGLGRQIFPGEANMDGFYYACLDKKQ